jgi:hypothetical protein
MKSIYSIILLLSFILVSCADEEVIHDNEAIQCSTPAIIRNYIGIDGCGYVLELNDGSILEPVQLVVCGPPPESIMTLEDPLSEYRIEGLKVLVDYQDFSSGSICMVGKTVKVTCITAVLLESSD